MLNKVFHKILLTCKGDNHYTRCVQQKLDAMSSKKIMKMSKHKLKIIIYPAVRQGEWDTCVVIRIRMNRLTVYSYLTQYAYEQA